MKIKVIGTVFFVILIAFSYFGTTVPFKDKVCATIEKVDNTCNEIFHLDVTNQHVFYKNDTGLMYANMNEDFSKVTNVGGVIDFNNANEKEPLFWSGSSNGEINFSMIWGIATKEISMIKIESKKNLQPNMININENLWLWYEPVNKSDFNMPIIIKAFDENGRLLSET